MISYINSYDPILFSNILFRYHQNEKEKKFNTETRSNLIKFSTYFLHKLILIEIMIFMLEA